MYYIGLALGRSIQGIEYKYIYPGQIHCFHRACVVWWSGLVTIPNNARLRGETLKTSRISLTSKMLV